MKGPIDESEAMLRMMIAFPVVLAGVAGIGIAAHALEAPVPSVGEQLSKLDPLFTERTGDAVTEITGGTTRYPADGTHWEHALNLPVDKLEVIVRPGVNVPEDAKITSVKLLDARTAEPVGSEVDGKYWIASHDEISHSNGVRVAYCLEDQGLSKLKFSEHVYSFEKSQSLIGPEFVLSQESIAPTQTSDFSINSLGLC